MRELGVVCHACFCTFYTSEMNTHSYMPFLFSIIVRDTQVYGLAIFALGLSGRNLKERYLAKSGHRKIWPSLILQCCRILLQVSNH